MNDQEYSYPGAERRRGERRRKRSRISSPVVLALVLTLSVAVAITGARLAAPALHGWYPSLARPRHEPPTGLFGPAWMVFHAMLAIAGWLVWSTRRARFRLESLLLLCLHLLLDLAWVICFFSLHRLLVAVVMLLGAWLSLAFAVGFFWQVRRPAATLALLCLALLSYAISLNLMILRLN